MIKASTSLYYCGTGFFIGKKIKGDKPKPTPPLYTMYVVILAVYLARSKFDTSLDYNHFQIHNTHNHFVPQSSTR